MALQPGTTNLPSLTLDSDLIVGGTAAVTGAVTFGGTVTFNNTVQNNAGGFQPGTIYTAAGTATLKSGFVGINLAGTGFAVQIPAPVKGAEFRLVCMATPSPFPQVAPSTRGRCRAACSRSTKSVRRQRCWA